LGIGEGREGERRDQNGMKSKEVPNTKALFVGMVWQTRNGVGEVWIWHILTTDMAMLEASISPSS
jgi:hypothetical protein